MFIQKNLIYLKNKHNVSYRKIASALNININAILRIKNGAEQNVTIKTIANLANFFDVTIDDLVYKDLSIENKLNYREKDNE
ncbi:helix-turn-helix domain-containing protein [Faecalitalea cylindroides]|uniref:helix-turn-helix domain-containing protein n=1 Tax=Faecalitalea cylindroides TaxID=39483 RepID=UPI00242BFF0D|nr:helix-turn-helix transcriptional regulator [Faecalitalea cylindroides]